MAISILSVKGVGPATAGVLENHGFASVKELAAAEVERLAKVPGFGILRARDTIANASEILHHTENPEEKTEQTKVKQPGKKKIDNSTKDSSGLKMRDKKRKDKKDKKDKKANKANKASKASKAKKAKKAKGQDKKDKDAGRNKSRFAKDKKRKSNKKNHKN